MEVISAPLTKPLGRKAYGSIGHLPGSRLGPSDHHVHQGQADICLVKSRDKHDRIIVTEKLDGSCCSVAKVGGRIVALGRAGWIARSSKYVQHHMFDEWVRLNTFVFDELLADGERVVGEWLAQAHGTRYNLPHEPYVIFDLFTSDNTRAPYDVMWERVHNDSGLITPNILSDGDPIDVKQVMWRAEQENRHGALDPIEGVVYRVERKGSFDFLAKFVRAEKSDGCYLPEVSNLPAVWNWQPKSQGRANAW